MIPTLPIKHQNKNRCTIGMHFNQQGNETVAQKLSSRACDKQAKTNMHRVLNVSRIDWIMFLKDLAGNPPTVKSEFRFAFHVDIL